MAPRSFDEAEYRFLTAPGAAVCVSLTSAAGGKPEVQIFGTRAGLLSLANVLLWLVATACRREVLTLAELPFVCLEVPLAICVRLTAHEAMGRDGLLVKLDHGDQYEWQISDDDLRRVALNIHHLACTPAHEYDYLQVADGSAAAIHVRMTDAAEWLHQGHSGLGD
jgi:hypothetical protein